MAKKRVYEIAKEKGLSSKELVETLKAAGIDVKAAASTVEESDVQRVLAGGASSDGAAPAKAPPEAKPAKANARGGKAGPSRRRAPTGRHAILPPSRRPPRASARRARGRTASAPAVPGSAPVVGVAVAVRNAEVPAAGAVS